MQIKNKEIKDYRLDVDIFVEKKEFDKARETAYIESSDKYVVPGKAGGMASIEELEKTYGPAVLFDEALEIVIPEKFNAFLDGEGIRLVGKPVVDDMSFEEGGVSFRVKAHMYPHIILGEYKDIRVPYKREGDQERFERAVIQTACENMKGEIPEHMAEQKLSAIIAREKINVGNEAIYHLLADALVILKGAYEAAGAVRPLVQIRREAMDLILQTASSDHENDWKDFFREQIKIMAERYHNLPADYESSLEKIINQREKDKKSKDQEALIDEVFSAYLGSLELSEEQWKNQRRLQANKEVCVDLLLDAVAKKEGIDISKAEMHQAIEDIAAQCNMPFEEVENKIDKEPLKWKMMRDKALVYILDNAGTDEGGLKRREEREKAQKEKIEKKKAQKEKNEKEKTPKEKNEKEKTPKEKIEKEKAPKEKNEKEKTPKEKIEKKKA